jgi:alpha-tubulin suppressor-like RCC1 family protein
MWSARNLGTVWIARWVLVAAAGTVVLSGLTGSAAASAGPRLAAGSLTNVVSVASDSAGGSYCAVLSTHHLDCWGYNSNGQLGDGTTTSSDVPVAAVGITAATAVASDNGGSFCAVLSTGHLDCWGYNGYGQLGNGNTTTYTVPQPVKNISTATAVIGSDYGFCAVLSTGHLDCWGDNGYGELGDGSTANDSDVPVAVHKITNAAAVIGGDYGFCARLSTSHLDCWGYGGYGALGNGTTTDSGVPVAVTGISTAQAVASDSASGGYCAVLSTGHLDCWGYNGSGQLGDGTTTSSDVPVAAIGITKATEVSGDVDGGSFCAMLSTGHLDCWGYNYYGELGNGNTTTYTLPQPVENVTTATAVTGGYYGFCARLSTSHLDCWGYGSDGELGNGATNGSDVPVAVHVITNGATVISGYHGFCARLSTSYLDCWGYNGDGELGNGTTNGSDVPVAVHAAS